MNRLNSDGETIHPCLTPLRMSNQGPAAKQFQFGEETRSPLAARAAAGADRGALIEFQPRAAGARRGWNGRLL
ncbi:hypothetical protein EVAR_8277_1 [Eumeta japonica]|uniref:Uncharacterized protein n=1 Tax=Eumeta variegata TaxID=151549 RepID=A0A4C1Y622_EUMVA|nr:hypothetical protein EVAR_8277_1 [Eumeta japonica]